MKKIFSLTWPILIIFLLWFIFSIPYFFKDRVPFPSTYQVNNFAPWDAYEKFWGPVKNGAMPDVITQIYPWRHLAIEIWKSGQIPLWNPYSFSGTPLLANYQSSVFSPFNVLFFILPFVDAWSILVLLQPLLAGLLMYLFVRSLKVGKTGSLVSAFSFMFCGFITVWMGYATLAYTILFLPLSLFSIEKFCQTESVKFLLLLSLTIPLSFFSGHFQISLYSLIFVTSYVFYKYISTRNISNTLYLLAFLLFGLLFSMPQLIPSMEFYTQSFRSMIFARGETIPWGYLPTLLSPDFFGNPVTRNDWFGHYAEWNAYLGVLPLMLAFYAITGKKRPQTFFLFTIGIIALLLAFDSPLLTLLITLHIPVLATSAASRIIVLFSFSFAVLAGLGFDQLFLDIHGKKLTRIILWLTVFLITFFILWMIVFLKLFLPPLWIVVARQNLILPTLLFFLSSVVILSILFLNRYRKLVFINLRFVFQLILIGIVAFDMFRFANKWQAFDPKSLVFAKIPTTAAFSTIAEYKRVFGNFGGEDALYYHLPSVEGYDALYVKRYGEFIASLNDGRVKESARSVVVLPKDGLYTPKAINLLNISYVVHKLADDRKVWAFPFWTYPEGQFKLIYRDNQYEFYENTKVFPRAFIVGRYKIINNRQAIVDNMFTKDFDLRRTVVLETNPNLRQSDDYMGTANIKSYQQNRIDIQIDAKHAGLLFLANSFYNGWEARIDGVNVPIYRADYTFQAVKVKKGQHLVEFVYNPWSFRLGLLLATFGLIGVITLSFASKKLNR